MQKIKNNWQRLLKYYHLHPKRFWMGGIVFGLIIFISVNGGPSTTITEIPVIRMDLTQTVRATGQVVSRTDLSLSFQTSDSINTLPVSVGDKVVKGTVLATLDNRDEYASLAEARAALKSAEAKYQKVADGASNEEIAVATASLETAKSNLVSVQKVQDTLVLSAYRQFLNVDLTPILYSGPSGTVPTVAGSYTGEEGVYEVTNAGGYLSYRGIETGTGDINTTKLVPLGTKGLLIQFPSTYTATVGANWHIHLPNKASLNYLTYKNAYEQALDARESALAVARSNVNEKEADLALKKAAARPADLAVAEAEVLSAQARLDAATVVYEKTILRAPVSGTITRIDTKIGERVEAQKAVIVLEDISNLYVEANINETNIGKILLGQQVSMTLDAFGADTVFTGTVMHVDPSATVSDGIVNYKIQSSIDIPACNDPACVPVKELVRPGMNANMTITAGTRNGVLAIPKAALHMEDGVTTVEVVTNSKKKKHEARVIETDFEGDGNLVEVIKGLADGENVAIIVTK